VKQAMKMTISMRKWSTLVVALGLMMFLGACHKKVAPPPPPRRRQQPLPRPRCPRTEHINQGQSTTLTWQTTNATDISIDGIGPVIRAARVR